MTQESEIRPDIRATNRVTELARHAFVSRPTAIKFMHGGKVRKSTKLLLETVCRTRGIAFPQAPVTSGPAAESEGSTSKELL